MSDPVFKVGDLVRFRPEHYGYRDAYGMPNEFVVLRVYEMVEGSLLYCNEDDCAFSYRVEAASGPW